MVNNKPYLLLLFLRFTDVFITYKFDYLFIITFQE